MHSLLETQQRFAAALVGGPADIEAAMALFAGDERVNRRRFAAYRRNVAGNWIHALRSTYPVIERRLGSDDFDRVAGEYLRSTNSRSGDLNEYGESFADFLAGHPALAPDPCLPDLARLEWDVQASYYAADRAPLAIADLAEVPAERHADLQFALAPAFFRMTSEFPLATIWHGQPEIGADAGGPRQFVWVVRRRGRVGVEPASAADDAFVAALADGDRLAAAIARTLAVDPDFNPGDCLGRLVQWGVLASFAVAEERA